MDRLDRIFLKSVRLMVIGAGSFAHGMVLAVLFGAMILVSPLWRIGVWIKGCFAKKQTKLS